MPDPGIDPCDARTWPASCPDCGEDLTKSRQCMGHTKVRDDDGTPTGERRHCRNRAKVGQTVCGAHGGKAPQALAAAELRLAGAHAVRSVATFGLPREVQPHEALLEELHRTAGHVAWLGELVAALQHQDSSSPSVMGTGPDDDGERVGQRPALSGLKQYHRDKGLLWEKPAVWVEMYQAERRHMAAVAAACIKANVDERRVALAEQQGQLLAKVVAGIVGDLGLDLQSPQVREVVTRHLQVVRAAA